MKLINDKYMGVYLLASTPRPNLLCYMAMKQDYSATPVYKEHKKYAELSEEELGNRIVKHCVNKGHWGVCYSADTEVLTREGFKLWGDVSNTDEIFAVDLNTNIGKFEKPQSLIQLNYTGEMIKFKHKRIDLLVTPDHKLCVKTRINEKNIYSDLHRKTAEDMYGRQFKMSTEVYISDEQRIKLNFSDNELTLIGFWLGDGLIQGRKNKLTFHVTKPRKTAFLRSLGCTLQSKDLYTYENKYLVDFLLTKCVDETGNKYLPDELLYLPYEQFLLLSDGLSQSDGSHRKGRLQYTYSSSHFPFSERLKILYAINGLSVKTTIEHHSKKNKNHRDNYRLRLHPNSEFRLESNHQSKVGYTGKVYCAKVSTGALLVRRNGLTVISGNCEHPSMSFNVYGFPHSVLVQARTHRIAITFDAQSQRYTGELILDIANELKSAYTDDAVHSIIEKYFYFRPVGNYRDRNGTNYYYSEKLRKSDIEFTNFAINHYDKNKDYAPEHARDMLTQNIRQHFNVTFNNVRSLLHFCDMRLPKDAQLEIRHCAALIFDHFKAYMPEVAAYYEKKRYGKNLLAP